MKNFSRIIHFCFYTILFAIISSVSVFAQTNDRKYEFCSNNYSNDTESFRELREKTISAINNLIVDGGKNGGIRVIGSDRKDILIRACVQVWGKTSNEAKSLVEKVNIETSPKVMASNIAENSNTSVSYEILVPRSTNLNLKTFNGGIGISSVDGMLEFEAHNGGISLKDVAGDVVGKTTNGGLNINLSGNRWKGNGLNVQTTNGGVNLYLPDNYAAQIEAGTVNGGFKSNIANLNVNNQNRNWQNRQTKINQSINGGGAPIRVVTTNGGVNINSSNN